MRVFTLLFMTFDESQSWYYEKNYAIMQRKSRRKVMDPNFKENLKFHCNASYTKQSRLICKQTLYKLDKLIRQTLTNISKVNVSVLFQAINGIIYNLKGLRMYTEQLVCWHLINMGSPKDFQSVHFHGQTFLHKKTASFRQAVYPLLPGKQH